MSPCYHNSSRDCAPRVPPVFPQKESSVDSSGLNSSSSECKPLPLSVFSGAHPEQQKLQSTNCSGWQTRQDPPRHTLLFTFLSEECQLWQSIQIQFNALMVCVIFIRERVFFFLINFAKDDFCPLWSWMCICSSRTCQTQYPPPSANSFYTFLPYSRWLKNLIKWCINQQK